ncbi:MAG: hypothetical protein ISR47_03625 [Rhodospirillales bacterium]|nr:hypothetical protein [Rhodospirillales bacterium]
MAHLRTQKTSFTAGEITPRLLGRGDLAAYINGAARLRNVFIHPTGGLSRRAGLRYVANAPGNGRLVAFEFNTEQVYLMVFTDQTISVYPDMLDDPYTPITTEWTLDQLDQINWTQSADTLLVVHPDVAPKKITRKTDGSGWDINDWKFYTKDEKIFQPYHKFADDDVKITPSATSGSITLTASADAFDALHVGTRFRIENKEVEITAFTSATQLTATTKENLASTTATEDWEEQAFSDLRGWPVSVAFHQDRMVIGGSRDLPNRLWLSKSTDLFNFDLGEGLDDEAIEFSILSDQVNAVRAVFSGRHLQVFTSGAEWMVTGAPLTPGNLELNRQTRIGSPVDRTIPPRDVDGATHFVSRSGTELREFLFADVEQAYQADDLAMLARHLMISPRDQDFDKAKRLLHVVMGDGSLGTVTIYRAENVTAWTMQETQGYFRSVAVVGEDTYVLVERDGSFFIEVFDDSLNVDSGLTGTDASPQDEWSGLDHIEGKTVKILADGAVRGDAVVSSGQVVLDPPAAEIQMGLGFSHVVEPLPPASPELGGASQGGKVRLIEATFRLHETSALRLDTGHGFTEIPFKRFGGSALDSAPPVFTGDKTVRAYGWKHRGTDPLWRIEHDAPLPFTLLAIACNVSAND